jgi:chemotaxis family two-component system sensor kinase Cph1
MVKSRSDVTSQAKLSNSLEHFYETTGLDALTRCDEEPIHQIGAVQAQGALMILCPKDLQLLAHSDNITRLLGFDITETTQPIFLRDLNAEIAQQIERPHSNISNDSHHILEYTHTVRPSQPAPCGDPTVFQLIYHEHQGVGYLEFIPGGQLTITQVRQKLRSLRHHSNGILQADTFDTALNIAAQAARELTGFASAHIYAFQPDRSGRVVAEARDAKRPSFLGLFFPEKDIPKQAMHLFEILPYRGIASAQNEISPIVKTSTTNKDYQWDLSRSLLRASATVHAQYLRNMDVNASFSASLMLRGRLWGLIACHHTQNGFLPIDLWGAMFDLAATLMTKLERTQSQAQEQMFLKLRGLETIIAHHLQEADDTALFAQKIMPPVRQLLNADGLAFRFGTQLFIDGKTPPASFIHELLTWATMRPDTKADNAPHVLATDALHTLWPEAARFSEIACGVLIEPINPNRVSHLIWFRGPITKTATWAGDPRQQEITHAKNAEGLLMPRTSFEAWKETHKGKSEPWSETERMTAREILHSMLDATLRQERLQQSDKNLKTFSFAAAHDLKTPLRHIRSSIQMIRENHAAGDNAETENLLRISLAATERLQHLVDNMMRYMVLNEEGIPQDSVNLEHVVDAAKDGLMQEITESNATLTIGQLPSVAGNTDLLITLLTNLMTNAIKYRAPDRPLSIEISAKSEPGKVTLTVSDNGIGIPAEHVKTIFEPFKRLHTHDQIAGSGLGLAICERIMAIHRGTLTVNSAHHPGAQFVIQLQAG